MAALEISNGTCDHTATEYGGIVAPVAIVIGWITVDANIGVEDKFCTNSRGKYRARSTRQIAKNHPFLHASTRGNITETTPTGG